MLLKMSSAEVVCCMETFASMTNFGMQTNSVDPDQTALIWVHTVCCRYALNGFADTTADNISQDKQLNR